MNRVCDILVPTRNTLVNICTALYIVFDCIKFNSATKCVDTLQLCLLTHCLCHMFCACNTTSSIRGVSMAFNL